MDIVKRGLVLMAIVGLPFIFSSCLDSPDVVDSNKQLQEEIASIDSYLTSQFLTAEKDPFGTRMVIVKLGKGLPAGFSSTVTVNYKGTLFSTGATFAPQAVTTGVVTGYIDGWKIALTSLPEGSKAVLYVPSGLGYGTQARTGIPANSTLVFEMEVIDVAQTANYLEKIVADSAAIDTYLINKGLYNTAVKDSTGIRYIITQPGTGPNATWYDKVEMKYTLRLLTDDANEVESDTIEPDDKFFSRVVDYIDGLKIGFQKMNEGSKATFYIPSGYCYGESSSTKIPANSNLIFEIELIDITQ